MRILIVDDEPGTLNALNVAFTSLGYPVKTATGGRNALNIIQSSLNGDEPIELLLTDLRMPVMNGYELIRSARKLDPTLPTMLMTAYGENDIQKETLKLGHSEYIEKPFKPEMLLKKIRKIELDVGRKVEQ